MRLSAIICFSGLGLAAPGAQLHLDEQAKAAKIPTSYESAVMGRRILALSKLATFTTVFPSSQGFAAEENRPQGLDGVPIGLVDYVADCEDTGNPTILAITIGTSFKNVRDGSNLTLSLRWTPPYPPAKRISLLSRIARLWSKRGPLPDPVPYSAANLARFSLFGHLEPLNATSSSAADVTVCYTGKHPDAKYWLPGNKIHNSEWMRFVVTHVYWIGGFGNRAYIGWIPVDEWKSVTRKEWEAIELPGEKEGWNEWTLKHQAEL
ncbi:hypothetical protein CDD81_7416 [Ophiocordyceps australis]|uniref:CREG-like beta-barrel domain-containing protein n=1 Tax=Ophiocordyceps australis TaxID=1399860 RepID=A0A2C5YHI4_9HYPO|nr:hypothetical protein CDD81_7416 [Ophiocordyceps australis]